MVTNESNPSLRGKICLSKTTFILITILLFVTPLFPRFRTSLVPIEARIGSVPIGVHHLIYLLIVVLVLLTVIPIIRIDRSQLTFFCIGVFLCSMIVVSGVTYPDIRTILSHGAVVTTAGAIGIVLASDTNIEIRHVIYSAYVAGLLIAAWDVVVLIGPFQVPDPTDSLLPGVRSAGIGFPVSMGTHGIVVGMGIVAGVSLYERFKRNFRHKILYIMTILLMVFSILLSGSRSSLMAVLIGMTVLLFYELYQSSKKTFLLAILASPVLLSIIGYLTASWRFRTFYQRIEQSRLALELAASYPFTGVGWQRIFPQYIDKVIHNTPAQYFAAGGFPVGLAFLLTIFYPTFVIIRSILLGPRNPKFLFTFTGMWAVILTELFFYKSTPSVFLFVVGMVVCYSAGTEKT